MPHVTQGPTMPKQVCFPTELPQAAADVLRAARAMAKGGTNSDAEVGAVLGTALSLAPGDQQQLGGALDAFARATGDDGLAGFIKATGGAPFRAIEARAQRDGELSTKDSLQVGADVLCDGRVDGLERMSLAAALLVSKMSAGARGNVQALIDDPEACAPAKPVEPPPPPAFPVYGAEWPWPGEGIRKYRFQPDQDGWISDHFFRGRHHAQVYYNVVSKAFEARAVGHGRDQPTISGPDADVAIQHAKNTIFNDHKLHVV